MRTNKTKIAAAVSASAATLLLSGAVAMAAEPGPAAAAKADAPTQIATMTSGKIVPVNLRSALATTSGYSFDKVSSECCGPYSQSGCDDFKYVPAE